MFFTLEKVMFYQEHHQTLFLINLTEKKEGKKIQVFDQNHVLTPLQKMQIFNFQLSTYL